ncbi:MAG: hypothetical protein ABW318_18575 [Vicinamibacterales bacterium]
MIARFWRNAPWWMAFGAAALALFDLQFSVVGRALTLGAIAIGLAGVLVAPWADALLLAIAMSLFPGDAWLLGVAPALLYRAARNRSLGFGRSLRSMLLVGFFISAAGSALFGLIAIEARPLQWFVWMATLGAPLLLLGGAFPRLPNQIVPVLSRFLLSVLWLQVPVCIAQLVRHGEPEPGDWFAGLWGDANLVGLWGAATMSVCAVRVLTGTAALKGPRAWVVGCGHFAAAAFLVWGASAKVYSASIFAAAGVVTVMLLIAGTGISRIGTVFRASVVTLAILLTGVLAESWVRDNLEGFISNWENSEKRTLLARMVFDVGQRYNSVLGVGPGMLASRAASAASGDVLHKETEGMFAKLLAPAPKPERWAMYGLWDAEVVQSVTNKSAIVAMPFSGWGSLRGELGWPAVFLLTFYLLSLGLQMASIAARHPGARSIGIAAAIGCVGLLPMLFFDNILEQPRIMGPLAILVITARGVASGLDRASASVRPTAFERPADHSRPHSSPPRGLL